MLNRFINLHKLEYHNKDAAKHLIRYITRTRPVEPKLDELISYGFNFGYIYNKPIEEIIKEFEFVQKYYNAEGCLMCHYVIKISNDTFNKIGRSYDKLNYYGSECCNYLFGLGHQACYAIHYSKEDHLHIHLAINAINFVTGKKLRQYCKEIQKTIEFPLDNLFRKHIIPDGFDMYAME